MKPALALVLLLGACAGGQSDVQTTPKTAGAVPPELVAKTWQVRLAVDSVRAPFEGRGSWGGWFNGKRLEPLAAMASESDPVGLARAHAEYAAIYRQAALIAANSVAQVYGVDAQPTDPKEVSYLLGVSGVILKDAALTGRLGQAKDSKVPGLAERDAAWKAWVDAGATWPPTAAFAGRPGALAALTPGSAPDAGKLPHFQLPEVGEPTMVDAGDPGVLLELALAHEAAAIAASPESAGAVALLIDPWRVPGEPPAAKAAAVTVPDTFLFLSAYTTPGDMVFASDLARDGWPAVAAHVTDSPYAVIVAKCAPEKKIDVDCVLDESAALGSAIEAGMAAAAGKQDSFHDPFANLARAGVFRVADRAAFALGDTDAGGRLRINAIDKTTGSAMDPLFLLSVAAWDAGNRNSVRAEDLVHGQLTEVPGLEAARLPLDALHIRLSRNAAPGRPMH